MPASDRVAQERWFGTAVAVVGALVALRLLALWFGRTDLFVDESQYWLWGQTLDWGYYSKPPLIAWMIRGVTDLAGSDAAFWVRMPGPVLHGVTALVAGAIAARLWGKAGGGRAALAVAAGYATLPMVSLGSWLFSTDTVMLPLLAVALWLWLRVLEGAGAGHAALAGLCIGLAMLGKYAGIYLPLGLALATLVVPQARARGRDWLAMGLAAAAVVSPNIVWNLANDLTTLSHTADNAGWLRGGARLDVGAMAVFLAEQAAVVGPVVVLAFLAGARRAGGAGVPLGGMLAVLAALPLAVVSVQALLGGANANWAVAGWLPGVILAYGWLAGRRVLLALSLAVNGALAVGFAGLTVVPDAVVIGDRPVMQRYIGRAAFSRQAAAAAEAEGAAAILSDSRDVMADLFHTLRGGGPALYAVPRDGRPRNFYEQVHALPDGWQGVAILVSTVAPACAVPLAPPDVRRQAYATRGYGFWRLDPGCLPPPLAG